MGGNIGQIAYVGDVWYQIMDKRQGENGESEYLLYTKDYWVPEHCIKDVRNKADFKKGTEVQ